MRVMLLFFIVIIPFSMFCDSLKKGCSSPESGLMEKNLKDRNSGKKGSYIPHTRYLKHILDQRPGGFESKDNIPSSFDLREHDRITPVKMQLTCGACWAFSSIASLESSYMPDMEHDFSENNMKNLNGFDWSPCSGGNPYMAAAYLMEWKGPVLEEDDPYSPNSSKSDTFDAAVKVQDVYIISNSDDNIIKSSIMKYGALTAALQVGGPTNTPCNSIYCNDETFAFYNPEADFETDGSNHAVTLVGWDDNYSKSNFLDTPANDGAWIVKNSYGPQWGLEGYFYVSYEDPIVTKEIFSFIKTNDEKRYSNIYSYDPFGMLGGYGYYGDTAWFANVFTSQRTEELRAVSFFVSSHNSSYVVRVYKNVQGAKPFVNFVDEVESTVSGEIKFAGYNTVNLKDPVILEKGDIFTVAVRLKTPDSPYPIPLEYARPGYTSSATASPGQSFMTSDESGEPSKSWSDTTTEKSTRNVCLKAYTVSNIDFEVKKGGAGNGTVAGGEINCGDLCKVSVFEFSEMKLSASPGSNSEFLGWEGDCTGTGDCELTVSSTTDVTAIFGCIDGVIEYLENEECTAGAGKKYRECTDGVWEEKCESSDDGSSGCGLIFL